MSILLAFYKKYRAKKAFKFFFKKKLKIRPIKPLVFNGVNRKKWLKSYS